LTWRQIVCFSPQDRERLTAMRLFNIVFPRIPDVLMNHASRVQ